MGVKLCQRFRHVLPSKTKSNVPRLVVDRAGKQKHTRIAYQFLAPFVNVLLGLEARESDRGGVWRSPFEEVVVAVKKLG